MKHVHAVSRPPQLALGGAGGVLQQLILLLQVVGEYRELAAIIQEKKGDGTT